MGPRTRVYEHRRDLRTRYTLRGAPCRFIALCADSSLFFLRKACCVILAAGGTFLDGAFATLWMAVRLDTCCWFDVVFCIVRFFACMKRLHDSGFESTNSISTLESTSASLRPA